MNWTAIFDAGARAHVFRHETYADILQAHIAENAQPLLIWQIEAATALTEGHGRHDLAARIDAVCGFDYPAGAIADLVEGIVMAGDLPVRALVTRDIPSDDVLGMLPLDRGDALALGRVAIRGIVRDIVRSVEYMGVWAGNRNAPRGQRIDATSNHRRELIDIMSTVIGDLVVAALGDERIDAIAETVGVLAEREFSAGTVH